MKHWRWLLLASMACLMSCLIDAPAAWFAPLLAHYSQHQLQLHAAQGSLWHGSAELWLQPGQSLSARPLPGRIAWQWQLRDGWQPSIQLDAHALGLNRWLAYHDSSGWILSPGQLQFPITVLTSDGLPWRSLQLQGLIQLHWSRLSYHAGQWQGRLQWQSDGLHSPLAGDAALGPYQLDSYWQAAQWHWQLSTLGGPLQLSGHGQLHGQHLQGALQAHCNRDCSPALQSLLKLWQPSPG